MGHWFSVQAAQNMVGYPEYYKTTHQNPKIWFMDGGILLITGLRRIDSEMVVGRMPMSAITVSKAELENIYYGWIGH